MDDLSAGEKIDVEYDLDINEKLFDEIFFDWTVYNTTEKHRRLEAITYASGTPQRYLSPRESTIARKSGRTLIYVLAHDLKTTREAKETYAKYPWARVLWIPTTYLLESVAYDRILADHIEEWEHADFVGTISYRATEKIPEVLEHIPEIFSSATDKQFVALFHKPDDLLVAAEGCHPGFTAAWEALCVELDLKVDKRIFSFYGNYWACRPSTMKEYLRFFEKVPMAFSKSKDVRKLAWRDSSYLNDVNQHLHMSRENCMRCFGVPYYPFHPFLCERLPCAWVTARGLDVMYVEV